MKRIIECIPNFSEGRDLNKINEIAGAIESVAEIKLMNVDPGKATNRTVITFAGEPEYVVEAAYRGIKKAAEIIDMRNHKGEHPRFGATDVCPLVPLSNITMEDTVVLARNLAERVGDELGIPVYCYEYAAFAEERKSLANCRSGEYEGLKLKLQSEKWKPDYGPAEWSENVAKSGAVAIGARNFLVAYNINLNTKSVELAKIIASEIRESGRVVREGDPVKGKIVTDEYGNPVRIPGSLKKTRAIGWYIDEYGCAQVSVNLTDITVTPLHVVFEEVCIKAKEYGIRVTGSEIIGMVPFGVLFGAGKYFQQKNKLPDNLSDSEVIKLAVKELGLDEISPFNIEKRIIEFALEDN